MAVNKILITTVGGSCAPVVNAVRMGNYDHVFFVCSTGSKGSEITVDGEGKPCEEMRDVRSDKSIVAQTGLSENQYTKWTLNDPDDLEICYQRLKELRRTIRQTFGPESLVVANYTGGTKTMSVVLSMAALADGWKLQVNLGPRTDLVKVYHGDVPVFATVTDIIYEDQYTILANQAVYRYDYCLALALANDLLQMRLSTDRKRTWIDVHIAAKGFASWDTFDHASALNLLSSLGRYYGNHLVALKKLTGQEKGNGYEAVSDLLNNAERRASQERFDDAVARLYRATEMVAQIRLFKEYELNSNKLNLNELPVNLRSEYEPFVRDKGKVLLGLRESFGLLNRLDDPVGKLFETNRNAVIGALTTRNNSILAHGTEPVGREGYEKVWETLHGFISEALDLAKGRLDVPQFPRDLPMLAVA
jgi:CRISPR-associated protein (TIGR02710 family)